MKNTGYPIFVSFKAFVCPYQSLVDFFENQFALLLLSLHHTVNHCLIRLYFLPGLLYDRQKPLTNLYTALFT